MRKSPITQNRKKEAIYQYESDELDTYKLMLENTEEALNKEKEQYEEDLRCCQNEIRRLRDVCRFNVGYIEALEKRLKENRIVLPEQ